MKRIWKLQYVVLLHDLLPFAKFKKRKKHPWRSVPFNKVKACNFTKSKTPPRVFFMFLKLCEWYQITPSTTSDFLSYKTAYIQFCSLSFYKLYFLLIHLAFIQHLLGKSSVLNFVLHHFALVLLIKWLTLSPPTLCTHS